MRNTVAATGFSRRHLRDKWWSSKVVELAFLGQSALPVLAGPLLPQGCRPGCSVSRPGVGSQVPSTLAASHRKPARHSGGRFSRAKRTINSLRAGLPRRRVTQEAAAPEAQAVEGQGLWLPSSLGTHSEDKESESSPLLGTAPVLGVGTWRGLCP